jgi:hypothetical protein
MSSVHEKHRQAIVARVPSWYRPLPHLALPSLFGLTVLVFAVTQIHALRAVELVTIPVTVLVGFAFEWRVHKSVLHRRVPGLAVIYERHELEHHVVFTDEDMAMRGPREFQLILMPAYAVLLIALFNAPIAYLAARLVTLNVGYIYLVTAMGFFLSYEWLHLAYHLPASHPIGRLGVIAALREHHRRHHEPRLMRSWNFNVTVPMFDRIHSTTWTREREAERAAQRSARRTEPAPGRS